MNISRNKIKQNSKLMESIEELQESNKALSLEISVLRSLIERLNSRVDSLALEVAASKAGKRGESKQVTTNKIGNIAGNKGYVKGRL